jgi:hypothetical protein
MPLLVVEVHVVALVDDDEREDIVHYVIEDSLALVDIGDREGVAFGMPRTLDPRKNHDHDGYSLGRPRVPAVHHDLGNVSLNLGNVPLNLGNVPLDYILSRHHLNLPLRALEGTTGPYALSEG